MVMVLDLDIRLLHFDAFQNNQEPSELLCKLILNIYRLIVPQNPKYNSYSNPLHSSMVICIHPIVIYCLHPRRKTVVCV